MENHVSRGHHLRR